MCPVYLLIQRHKCPPEVNILLGDGKDITQISTTRREMKREGILTTQVGGKRALGRIWSLEDSIEKVQIHRPAVNENLMGERNMLCSSLIPLSHVRICPTNLLPKSDFQFSLLKCSWVLLCTHVSFSFSPMILPQDLQNHRLQDNCTRSQFKVLSPPLLKNGMHWSSPGSQKRSTNGEVRRSEFMF